MHAVEWFGVPRPAGLLGHQNLARILDLLEEVVGRRPGEFLTFRLSAAGADSPELLRLRGEIGRALRLEEVRERAHLVVALRRGDDGSGWEIVVRTTPRPLSARAWRVCNLPGALDASIANVMVRLAQPHPGERFLNLLCGSGTLMAERLALGPTAACVGVDSDPAALACAAQNLTGTEARARLVQADAAATPLQDGAFDTVVADLPFGMLMGSGHENRRLYPALLAESARLLAPDGRLVLVTANVRALDTALEAEPGWTVGWQTRLEVPHARGYLRPVIRLLERRRVRR